MNYKRDSERLTIMRQLVTLSIREQLRCLEEQKERLERAAVWVDGSDSAADEDEMADLAFSIARLITDLGLPGMEEDAMLVANLYCQYAKLDDDTKGRLDLTTNERRPFSNSTNIHEDAYWAPIDINDLLVEDAEVV